MRHFAQRDWGLYHRQITFGVAVAFVLISLTLTYLESPAAGVADTATAGSLAPMGGGYQSPDRCRTCHDAEYQAWTDTTHAHASFDPIFQTYLQKAEQPGECFGCHTTGYDTSSGQFVLAGVSCEACHGPYRPGHPQTSMAVASAKELCGHCHTSTRLEWESSRHGQVGVDCLACHEVHSQKTRQSTVTNVLCAGCHIDRTTDDTHNRHLQAGVLCVSCHLSRPPLDAGAAVSGHAPTGHAFTVKVSTCGQCHPGQPFSIKTDGFVNSN